MSVCTVGIYPTPAEIEKYGPMWLATHREATPDDDVYGMPEREIIHMPNYDDYSILCVPREEVRIETFVPYSEFTLFFDQDIWLGTEAKYEERIGDPWKFKAELRKGIARMTFRYDPEKEEVRKIHEDTLMSGLQRHESYRCPDCNSAVFVLPAKFEAYYCDTCSRHYWGHEIELLRGEGGACPSLETKPQQTKI